MDIPVRGIIPPVVTPLLNNHEIDEDGLAKLIEHLISGGVHGLFLLGTTGEAPSLSYKLREQFVKKACELTAGRIPIMVGITDTSFEGSIEMASSYKEAGADAVVIAPPYYIPISQSEMIDYLEALVPQLPLPFLLYNMPGFTKLHMTEETVAKAKELGALGIKDSSGDMFYLYSLINKFKNSPDFSIITGTEIFIPETIMQKGHGAVPGGANMFPKLFVDLYNASVAGNQQQIAQLREVVMKIYNTIYSVGPYTSKYIIGTKCALSVMGICSDYVAHPIKRFDEKNRKQIAKYLDEIKADLAENIKV